MKVGLLVIGSEILDGMIIDTNTRFLAEYLRSHHYVLAKSMTVRDQENEIKAGLDFLLSTCDVVVTSGGLGPTKDDMTKQTLASYLGREIIYSSEAQAVAIKNAQRLGRPSIGKEHGYSFLPTGFVALENSTGTAPALFTEHLHHYIFCGAGVPREFKSMLEDHFLGLVKEKFPQDTLVETVTVRTKKIPEEKIFNEVDPTLWEKLATYGSVSSLPNLLGVDIGVTIVAKTSAELTQKKKEILSIFEHSPLKPSIWHIGREPIEEVIVRMANKKKITFGFAESCTGGLCSSRITNISGSSQSFMGSVVSYDSRIKMSALGVSEKTLEKYSAESSQTAIEMASGLAKKFNLAIAVSITGLAGPGGGTKDKPVGTVYIGVCMNGKTKSVSFNFTGDREHLKNRFSQAALFELLESMENLSSI